MPTTWTTALPELAQLYWRRKDDRWQMSPDSLTSELRRRLGGGTFEDLEHMLRERYRGRPVGEAGAGCLACGEEIWLSDRREFEFFAVDGRCLDCHVESVTERRGWLPWPTAARVTQSDMLAALHDAGTRSA